MSIRRQAEMVRKFVGKNINGIVGGAVVGEMARSEVEVESHWILRSWQLSSRHSRLCNLWSSEWYGP